VTWSADGDHALELLSCDGRSAARRERIGGSGAGYLFENLRPGVYVLAGASPQGRITRLVAVP
jgi:hypothetical protein